MLETIPESAVWAIFALPLASLLIIGVLMGIELMLNSINLTLIGFARFAESPRPIDGQVFAVFVVTVAAAEASVALALAVSVYRLRQTIDVDKLRTLKW